MRTFEFAMKDGVKMYGDAQLPEYQTKSSAGADFFSAEDVVVPSIFKHMVRVLTNKISYEKLEPFIPTLVHTGIKANMYDDEVLELYNRSSNPKKGLVLANGVGVVDADYYSNPSNDGEIMFAFYNFMPFDVTIHKGDRIGQGVFKKFIRPEKGINIKDETRAGGFGSTDNT